MMPEHVEPQTITVVTPAEETDGYGDTVYNYTVPPATTRDTEAFVQPALGVEVMDQERNAVTWDFTVFTNDATILPREQVIYKGDRYRVDRSPREWDIPAGFHHTELRLTRTTG